MATEREVIWAGDWRDGKGRAEDGKGREVQGRMREEEKEGW